MSNELEGAGVEPQSGGKPNEQESQGKAWEINENTVGGKAPAPAPRQPDDKPSAEKSQGKAWEINENSV